MSAAPTASRVPRARRRHCVAAALAALLAVACDPAHGARPSGPQPVDAHATAETRALFANLKRYEGRQVMFGHQDDLAYGHTWRNEPGRSDVKEASGSYPAVYGWELGNLELGKDRELDGVRFDQMRGWIADGYRRGGVITISWHMGNPVSGGNAWDTTSAVAAVLPGGARHQELRDRLDRFAAFASSLRATDASGRETLVPFVFRPFHEMTGSWFWWGGRNTTPEQYQQLYRFTVSYLRDTKGVHNVLYAYSPDVTDSRDDYLRHYPGDDYVDVLGFDDYQSIKSPATRDRFVRRLHDLVELADARGKVPALTETGVESIPDSAWFTGTLLAGIKADSITRRIAWVSVWRNAPVSAEHPNHFFASYAGHASAPDFVRFRQDSLIAFEDELLPMYAPARPAAR